MRALRQSPFVVYAKPPFGGPARVLAYLARYTHRTAIANSRLVAVGDNEVAFPRFWGEVQPPASLKGLDIPSRRAVFVPWKPSRRPAFGMGNPTFR